MNDFENIFKEIQSKSKWDKDSLQKILKKYPKEGKGLYRHDELVREYKRLIDEKKIHPDKTVE